MSIPTFRRRPARPRQRMFAFVDRKLRRERQFKRAILLATGLAVVLIFQAIPWGPQLSASIDAWARRTFGRSVRVSRSRAQLDEWWRQYRVSSIARTRPRVQKFYTESNPAFQGLLRYAGMDPEHGLLGWGNYNWTLLLSSRVFEPDDRLSYRLRPRVRSIWLRNLQSPDGGAAFYLVPDGPGLAEAIRGTPAVPLPSSRQSTNSWGVRGPEPDPKAPLRGLVLGDSYMQGMFIGDDETPPECLRRYLDRALNTRASVLNAGLMGYSPEQYYHSLIAFAGRFRPHFVVVSIFANDCGSIAEATGQGLGDWREGKYWLERIARDCREHGRPFIVVPAPYELSLVGKRRPGFYPGKWANLLDIEGPTYLDPMDDFLNAHLKSRIATRRQGRSPWGCALFNDAINDNHFSGTGAAAWAESVGRRLVLMLEDQGILARPALAAGKSRPDDPGVAEQSPGRSNPD